ncbi:hypothetical protein KCU72_g18726, partial [Aureobasidium melanogenum]
LFPKSRRLLHSSFWSTNAPDVDHLCLYPKPASSAPASSDSHDAPLFLDFLYPAPTQAFMTRLSQWERWSRKNTRPNVLRGYSSLTAPKDPSPSSTSLSRAHQELLVLLESPSPDQSFLLLDIERAWNLLSQISDPSPDLLCRAIDWFSNIDDKAAAQHAVDLFSDLPDRFKSPTVYGNAIRSNLRLGRQSVAVALHKEASVLPTADSIASDHLMALAVSKLDWPLAVTILKEWETYNATVCRKGHAPLFNETIKKLRRTLTELHHLHVKGIATNRNCSAIVTATYLLYRQSEFFSPTKPLLTGITTFWRAHNLAFAGQGPDKNFIGKDSILDDWNKYHQRPSDEALVIIMDTFAQRGLVEAVKEYADLYKSFHAKGDMDASYLRPLLTVHAVNRKPSLAAQQLHNMQSEYGVLPNLRCWNIVLHAFTRVDDLPQAMKIFRDILDSGLRPNGDTYTLLLNAYAKQGDIDSVIDLLNFARSNGATRPTTKMLNSMIVALARGPEMDGALKTLDQTVQAVQEGRADGSLTLCFNTVLTAFAWKRDFKATMATYRRMQEANVPLDERSYGAL